MWDAAVPSPGSCESRCGLRGALLTEADNGHTAVCSCPLSVLPRGGFWEALASRGLQKREKEGMLGAGREVQASNQLPEVAFITFLLHITS